MIKQTIKQNIMLAEIEIETGSEEILCEVWYNQNPTNSYPTPGGFTREGGEIEDIKVMHEGREIEVTEHIKEQIEDYIYQTA